MKTYNTFPLVAIALIAGVLLGTGLTLVIFTETLFGHGGGMICAGIALALFCDHVYGRCRLIEDNADQAESVAKVGDTATPIAAHDAALGHSN